ncbi:sugar ABC transporter substrate-binding protein [Dyella acidiphila]|uniref:Sugar ABC transporter substrate-binding protein n=1 Tax=Dyella acidiphila TaxID=2775866 RepID=A0ABR9G5Q6_9GAMM|nr:sugar ABC transporter substrate-binding protein [Dyella acidiphila]MBE1159386.1 sugar ABC transporter substrate-binding protein [Dyella acidiphila]
MRVRWRFPRSTGLLLAGAMAAIGAGAALAASPQADQRYVLISHAPDSDAFWNTIKNAVSQAGQDFGVQVDYRNPPNGDLADMARLLEQAAARNYDGVAFDIADFDVLSKPAMRISAKRIPIVTINSGTAQESQKLGAIMHIGQPEYEAGKAAGERAKAAGIKNFVCVNHYVTNVASFERCKGFADALGVDARSSMIDSGIDPTVVAGKVSAYLRNHPGTQAVLALGPPSGEPALQALQKMGVAGKTYFVTFDLSPAIIDGIRKGYVNFAIDQQPYLQGYVAIAALAIAHASNTRDAATIIANLKASPKYQARLQEYGLVPVYTKDGLSSGPAFVTKDNVETVAKYAGQYR